MELKFLGVDFSARLSPPLPYLLCLHTTLLVTKLTSQVIHLLYSKIFPSKWDKVAVTAAPQPYPQINRCQTSGPQ